MVVGIMSSIGNNDSKVYEFVDSVAERVKESAIQKDLSDLFDLIDKTRRLLDDRRNKADRQASRRQQQEQHVADQTQEVSQEPTVGGRGGTN